MADMICHKVYELLMSILKLFVDYSSSLAGNNIQFALKYLSIGNRTVLHLNDSKRKRSCVIFCLGANAHYLPLCSGSYNNDRPPMQV
jgi:hypothetical protein